MINDKKGSELKSSQNRRSGYFTCIPHELARDNSISLAARGLLSLFLSFPENWNLSIPHIIEKHKISKNIIYNLINELIDAGYMKRENYQEKGLLRYFYTYSDFKEFLPYPENQDTEKQDPEKQDSKIYQENPYQDSKEYQKKVLLLDIEKKEKEEEEILPKLKKEKKEVAPDVWLTAQEQKDFLEKHKGDQSLVNEYYRQYSVWKKEKGISIKADFKNLCDWKLTLIKHKVSNVQENAKIAEMLKPKYDDINKYRMSFGYNYIEFVNGANTVMAKFEDKDFMEKLKIQMAARKLPYEQFIR